MAKTLLPLSQRNYKVITESYMKICCSHLQTYHLIRPSFSTCHDSSAVVTCAKLWPVWAIQINIREKRILTIFQLWAHNRVWAGCLFWIPWPAILLSLGFLQSECKQAPFAMSNQQKPFAGTLGLPLGICTLITHAKKTMGSPLNSCVLRTHCKKIISVVVKFYRTQKHWWRTQMVKFDKFGRLSNIMEYHVESIKRRLFANNPGPVSI